MKGVVRSAWLMLGAERYQQLALITVALLVLGAAPILIPVLPPDPDAVPTWDLMLKVGSLTIMGSMLMMGGITFRAAVAPRSLTLIPYSRLRLALGALLAVMVVSALVTASAALQHLATPRIHVPWGSLADTFGGALGLGTLAVLFGFLFSGGSLWSRLGWPTVLCSGGVFLGALERRLGARFGLGPAGVFEIVGLVGAACFAAWYFSARLITPPLLNHLSRSTVGGFGIRSREVLGASAGQAVNLYLLGQPSALRVCWLPAIFLICNNLLYVFGVLRYRLPGTAPDWSFGFALSLMLIAACGTYFPSRVLYRARALWIRGGFSRLELFAQAEKVSLRCFAWTGGPPLAMWAAVWLYMPFTRGLYLLLLAAGTASCCVYLSLLAVRSSSQFNLFLLGYLVFTWGVLLPHGGFFPFTQDGPWEFLVPVAEMAGALVLRSVAQKRWQRIDWLICKPPRNFGQRLRPSR